MLFRIIPRELIDRQNEVELTLYMKGGSMICLKGADNPDTLRGAGPYGVVFDEFATMKYEAWGIVEPVLRANGGWAWFIGTPKGKNHLYEFYNRGQEGLAEWRSWLLKASISGIVDLNQLEESRRSMSEALYNQEWECAFLEGEGSVFRGVKDILTATPQAPVEGHAYIMGVDLAKVKDYTVMAVYDRANNNQVYQDRIRTIEWPFQKTKIKAVASHYNNALAVVDATGIGDPICDDLLRSGVAVEPLKITEQSKKDLIEKLSIFIEHKYLRMLPIEETATEFENFTYEIGPTGYIRYTAPQGFTDDIVMAHALAVSSLNRLGYKEIERKETLISQYYDQQLNRGRRQQEEWSSGF